MPYTQIDNFLQPGGQDSQLVLPDSLSTYVTTNYLLKTSDPEPAYITVQTTGWRTGPKEVMEKLFNPEEADTVKASEYSFRLSEAGDRRPEVRGEGKYRNVDWEWSEEGCGR